VKHWPHVLPLLVPVLAFAGVFLPDLVRTTVRHSGWLLAAAVGSVVAAAVHVVVTPEHFRESVLFGAFFVALAACQLGYAAALLVRPTSRLLAVGIVGAAGAVVLWALTRTVGLPLGPEVWRPEPVGALDLVAVAAELTTCLSLARALQGTSRRGRGRRSPVPGRSPARVLALTVK
jgi:hypothetical protein